MPTEKIGYICYELLSLRETNSVSWPPSKDDYRDGQGRVFYGQDIDFALPNVTTIKDFYKYYQDEGLGPKAESPHSTIFRDNIIDVRTQDLELIKEGFPLLKKYAVNNIIIGDHTFYFAMSDTTKISHSPWTPYLVIPKWEQDINEDGWGGWLLPYIAEQLGNGVGRLMQNIDPNIDRNKKTITSLERAVDGVWRSTIMPHLLDLARQEYKNKEFYAPDPILFLKRLARFLPKLSGKEGREAFPWIVDVHGPKHFYGLAGLRDRWEIIMLLEGYLVPEHYKSSDEVLLRLPHPVIAYRIANELQDPPCQYAANYLEFLSHYDLASYRQPLTPGRK
jgi:hypothetical protein